MTPRATYRLQLHKDFGFAETAAIAEYLARLGISDVYSSPWLKARPGSSHGYDIVDHNSLNPELGDEASFESMIQTLDSNGLGRVLDIVPNHMGVGGSDNPLWLELLEMGSGSTHAGWFDIDWRPDRSSLQDKVLVPLLANQYGIELLNGKLSLKFDPEEGAFAVWAYDVHKLPICPLHYQRILGDEHLELERFGDCFASIEEWRPQIGRRARDLKSELANAVKQRSDMGEAIAAAVQRFNGTPGVEGSWNGLHLLIQDQHWRAAHFRVAGDDINYRRFFDINELAGLRMELPDVFEHAHSLIFHLFEEGKLNGLRIDHIDGLLDPGKYLRQVRGRLGETGYLVVEKILAQHESLRGGWPIEGTTGYEFANLVFGLCVDQESESALTEYYSAFTGEARLFSEVVRECKLRVMRNEMASELNVLGREAAAVAYQQPNTADFTQNVLRRAIREIIACFPVYRTYVDGHQELTAEDRRDLIWAFKRARSNETDIDASVFDFLEDLLTGALASQVRSGYSRHSVVRCAMKFQQYSGPVMAKGLEDTAFYRYNRFVALNEVGGQPDLYGTKISAFHKANLQRAKFWPHSMLTTSTHDTKRGEDARARLAVISEIPDQWIKQTRVWSHILRTRHGDVEAVAPPDRNDEYLLYQLLVASWPADIANQEDVTGGRLGDYPDRLKQAVRKSIREAKVHSTWAAPNLVYEDSVMSFIDGALDCSQSSAFLDTFLPFQQQIARFGVDNSLVQTALKLTVPGVPDIYQGSELWNLSLVDPDNRRPVDYAHRITLLDELDAGPPSIEYLMNHWQNGAIKLFLTSRILRLRAIDPELFSDGDYEPLLTSGPKADWVFGFSRVCKNRGLLLIAARFPARRAVDPGWDGTVVATPVSLIGKAFRNLLTGARFVSSDIEVALDLILEALPLAILVTEP